jgi:hypothetical protein
VAVELVAAVRALRPAGHTPTGAGTRALYTRAPAPPAFSRTTCATGPLAPDIELARRLI